MGFRAIGRFLGVSHVAVYYWVKSFGKAAESARNTATEVKAVEMDELHSYVGYKKTTAGSTPTGHKGRLLIDMGNGFSVALWVPATRKLGGRPWAAIERPGIEAVMADYLCPLGILCPLRCIRNPIPTGHKGRDLHD